MFEEIPQIESEETHEIETSSPGFRVGALAVALLAFVALFGYSIHERNVAGRLAAANHETSAALQQTRAQIDALNAKLDALAAAHQSVSAPAAAARTR